jgi:hypothetical protein
MSFVEATPVAEPQRRGWFRRNWWWVLLLVFGGCIVICAGLCAGVFAFGVGALKSSDPYQAALAQVRQDKQVIARLGEPIEDAMIPTGEVNITNDRGEARLSFDVSGPKGSAKVVSQSKMIGGKWGLTQLEVTFQEDGQRIVINTATDNAENDAPPWKP